MKKLRLLLFEDCNRNCEGCCNKDWYLKSLPKVENFCEYEEVILTGGEPMLRPYFVIEIAKKIRSQSLNPNIFLYTAKTNDWQSILSVLHFVDGITITLHEQSDVEPFLFLNDLLYSARFLNDLLYSASLNRKSLRLNIFEGIKFNSDLSLWEIKDNIKWIKNCPLPKDEVFMRL